jgi:hypothetical protein
MLLRRGTQIILFRHDLHSTSYKKINEKLPFGNLDFSSVDSNEEFYKSQLQERERAIQDLKVALDVIISLF